MRTVAVVVLLGLAIAAPRGAEACCGLYVAASDHKLASDATQVVVMRMGTRTVLSIQRSYQGPPEAFAIVVPVPAVIREADVRTLAPELFARVEQLSAPRLVESWEQDPCGLPSGAPGGREPGARPVPSAAASPRADALGVTVEARLTTGEYQIVILSAKDATGLEAWLGQQRYHVPDGVAPMLRSYVEAGSKFFVAKVDPARLAFDSEGRAALSPLRVHYDSDDFALPIRLAPASSSGTQDLIVHVLAPHQRYDVANYRNVTIPTNLDVGGAVQDRFPAFYAALFDRTLERNPGAVVTEYAWPASSCDPCTGPALDARDLAALGADVLAGPRDKPEAYAGNDLVLTRLHLRTGKAITEDLRFRAATAITGGREPPPGRTLDDGARPAPQNSFQGRYTIRQPWNGPIRCEHPVRKLWGGPPPEIAQQPGFRVTGVEPAVGLAFAPRGAVDLARVLRRDLPALGVTVGASRTPGAGPGSAGSAAPAAASTEPAARGRSGCGCAAADPRGGLAIMIAIGCVIGRRRRRA